MKIVSNEQLIVAIFANKTLAAAADAAGISLRSLHDRMRDPEFKLAYSDAKAAILREAVENVNGKLCEALEIVAAIMRDEDNNAAVRLQAAQTIINQHTKLRERLAVTDVNFINQP